MKGMHKKEPNGDAPIWLFSLFHYPAINLIVIVSSF